MREHLMIRTDLQWKTGRATRREHRIFPAGFQHHRRRPVMMPGSVWQRCGCWHLLAGSLLGYVDAKRRRRQSEREHEDEREHETMREHGREWEHGE